MSHFLEVFGDFSVADVVVFLSALGFVITMGVKLWKFITKTHDNKQDKDETLNTLVKKVDVIGETQEELKTTVASIKANQDEICERLDCIEYQSTQYKRNSLKEKLLSHYHKYASEKHNPMMAWSEMEKDAFDCMFEDYEELGGNGYMHSEVKPAMDRLDVIPMSESAKIIELLQSRKG